MAIEIKEIIKVLSDYNTSQAIQPRLQTVSRMLRFGDLSLAGKEQLEQEKQALEVARIFLDSEWKKNQPHSADYLHLLTQWFQEEECSIENKDFLAASGFYEHLKSELAKEESPIGLIALADKYFYEPIQFTAFIFWLLESVSPKDLIASKLLHAFIATHFYDSSDEKNPLHKVYALLRMSDSDEVKSLLELADNTYCGIRGFESKNLSGGQFQQAQGISAPNVVAKLPSLNYSPSDANIDALWQLFDMDFIIAINFNRPEDQKVITRMLSLYWDKILPEIPGFIINDQIPIGHALKLLRFIANDFKNTPSKYITIVQQFPFYLQVLPYAPSLLDHLPNFSERVEHYLKGTVKAPINSTVAQLLVDLCCFLDKPTTEKPNEITMHVFNLLLGSQEIGEEISTALERLPHLQSLSINELKDFTDTLSPLATPEGMAEFNALYDQWSELLPRVNMLKLATPNLNHLCHYPFHKHELMGFMIESVFVLDESKSLDLSILIESMQEQLRIPSEERESNAKRILLETLVYTQHSNLQNQIISVLEHKKIDWIKERPGDQHLLLLAVLRGNTAVVLRILSFNGENKPDQEAVEDALRAAASKGQLEIVTHILNLTGENKPDQEAVEDALRSAASEGQLEVVIHILNLTGENKPDQEAVEDSLNCAASEGQLEVVTYILNLTGENKPDQKAVEDALRSAASEGQLEIVIYILNLTGENKPDQKAVKDALRSAASEGQLEIVIHILNLTGEKEPDQEAVMKALAHAASEGQLQVVSYILNLTTKNKPEDAAWYALVTAAEAGQLEVVIHILNLNDSTFDQNEVGWALWDAAFAGQLEIVIYILNNKPNQEASRALDGAARRGHMEIVTYILNLTGDNQPDQKAVGDALKSAADEGQLEVVTYLLNLTGDNQPDQKAVGDALKSAADEGQLEVVTYLLNLTGDNQPSDEALREGLLNARMSQRKDLSTIIIQKLENRKNDTLNTAAPR